MAVVLLTHDKAHVSSPSDPHTFASLSLGGTADRTAAVVFVYQRGATLNIPTSVKVEDVACTRVNGTQYAGGAETIRIDGYYIDLTSETATNGDIVVDWNGTPDSAAVAISILKFSDTANASGPNYTNVTSNVTNVGAWYGSGMPDGAIAIIGMCNADGTDPNFVSDGTNWTAHQEGYEGTQGIQYGSAYYINTTGSTLSSAHANTKPDITNDESRIMAWTGMGIEEALAAYTLDATTGGSYSLSGQTAALEVGYEVAAGPGSYAVSGTDALLEQSRTFTNIEWGLYFLQALGDNLYVGRAVIAEGGSYAVGGTAATLQINLTLTAEAGSYAVTGTDAALTIPTGVDLVADGGSYSVAGTDAALEVGYAVAGDAGSYTVNGSAATLQHAWVLSAEAGAYSVSGTAATFLLNRPLTAEAGSYALTGTDANLERSRNFTAEAGSYAVSGTDALLEQGYAVTAEAGSYAVSGTDATLQIALDVLAESGAYSVSGTDAALEQGYLVGANAGSYAVTGTAATPYPSTVLYPNADVTDGSWLNELGNNTNLYASIDEIAANDTDYIESPALSSGNSDTCEIALTASGDPQRSFGHKFAYRYQALGVATMNLTVRLIQGTTIIASNTHNSVGGTLVNSELTLSAAEADSITDYSDLRLRFTAEAA